MLGQRMRERLTVKEFEFSPSIGYAVSAVTFAFGMVIVSGLFIPTTVPLRFRLTFGVVLTLLGIYRFVVTRMKSADSRMKDE